MAYFKRTVKVLNDLVESNISVSRCEKLYWSDNIAIKFHFCIQFNVLCLKLSYEFYDYHNRIE